MTPAEVRRAVRNLLAERPRSVVEVAATMQIDYQRVRSAFGVLARRGEIHKTASKRWELA